MELKYLTLILLSFLIGLLVAGLPLVIMNENTQKAFDDYKYNANQSFNTIKAMNLNDQAVFQAKYNSLLIERNKLVEENELMISTLWDLVKNPLIITIVEERSHTSSSSRDSSDDEDECSPCPQLQRCPPGKSMETDGEDECGCAINPRCVGTSNVK